MEVGEFIHNLVLYFPEFASSYPIFLITLGILLILLISLLFYLLLSKSRDSIKYLAKTELGMIRRRRPIGEFIKNLLNRLALPQKESYIFLLIANTLMLFVGIFLKRYLQSETYTDTLISNILNSNLEMYGIMVSIIIAFFILIAEGLRDGENESRGRTKLVKSLTIPSVFSVVYYFILTLIFQVSNKEDLIILYELMFSISIILISAIGLFKVIKIYVFKAYALDAESTTERLVLISSLETQLRKRIKKKISYDRITGYKYRISYIQWPLNEKYDVIYAPRNAKAVEDIHPEVFFEIIDELENALNVKRYTLKKESSQIVGQIDSADTTQDLENIKYQPVELYIHSLVTDSVDELHRLLSFNKSDALLPSEIKKFETRITKAFKFDYKENSKDEYIRYEWLDKSYNKAINESDTAQIKVLNDKYIEIIKIFWEFLESYGINYSLKEANNEMSFFQKNSTWKEVTQVLDGIKVIFRQAVKTPNHDLLIESRHLPAGLIYSSIGRKDYYVFKSITDWYFLVCYEEAIKTEDKKKSKYLKETAIAMTLHELTSYLVMPYFRDKYKNKVEADFYLGFTSELYKQYMLLMKFAIEKNKFEDFDYFLMKFLSVAKEEHLLMDLKYSIQALELDIKRTQDQNAKEELECKLKEMKIRNQYERDFQLNKYSILWGISAWLLDKDYERYGEFVKKIMSVLPSNIDEISEIYLSIVERNFQERWGWELWKHEDVRDFEPQVMDSGYDYQYSLVLVRKMLESIKDKDEEAIKEIQLPASRHYYFALREGGQIKSNIDNYKNENLITDMNLGSTLDDKLNSVISILETSKITQEAEDRENIQSYEVTQKKIENLSQAFIRKYEENNKLRQFLKENGCYVDNTNKKIKGISRINRLGINQIIDKEAFLEDWHVHYPSFGEEYADAFIRGESKSVFESLKKKSKVLSPNNIKEVLSNSEAIDDWFLIGNHSSIFSLSRIDENVDYVNRQDSNILAIYKYKGKEIPIYDFGDGYDTILLLNTKHFGFLEQLSPWGKGFDKKNRNKHFYFYVDFYSHNDVLKNDILQTPPEWLSQRDDKEEYLNMHGVIKIFERFRFVFDDEFIGYKIKVKDV